MLYRNTHSMEKVPDGITSFGYTYITTGVLRGINVAPCLYIMCLDYILKNTVDNNNDFGCILSHQRNRCYPAIHITCIDYADDLDIISNTMEDANSLFH